MQRDGCRRASHAPNHRRGRSWPLLTACLLALAAAGCSTAGQPTASIATPRGNSIAFESIDGPPRGVFQKMVVTLNEEAQQRSLNVASRDQAAAYRVRGYLAAHTVGTHTAISWVWDVYDAEDRRALRLSGEEKAAGRHRDAWAAVDDAMLRRIAREGLDRLASFMAAEPAPGADGTFLTAMAAHDENSPEAFGIFRLSADRAEQAEPTQPMPVEVPLPRRRPRATAAVTASEHLAWAAPSR